MPAHHELAQHIWQIADLLRGPYRPPQYERVMLPLTVLRRFDCVLAEKKPNVVASHKRNKDKHKGAALDAILNRVSGQKFHNKSPLDFQKLKGDPDNIDQNLIRYIESFSENVRRIFEYFEFTAEIEKMRESNILYLVVSKFADIDLTPPPAGKVSNKEMGLAFENLIRRFNELANETAGDHFTPREVIHLMVDLLFMFDDDLLSGGAVRTMLDPACGTGGMLAEAQNYISGENGANRDAKLYTYGQDYNKRAFATAASDMLIKEVAHNGAGENIKYGDSLIDDQFEGHNFDYLIANPPFGVDWKKQQKEIKREHEKLGFAGRFGAGLPRVNDGSLLFLQHMISKFEPNDPDKQKNGSRLAIVFSGSPLFTGGAGSGESNIRKWIIENDWLEGIVALPEQMFYNTGIGTYVWLVTNRKEPERRGKVILYDARDQYIPMKRSLGDKRRKIGEGPDADDGPEPNQIADIVKGYGAFAQGKRSKVFDNEEFGYTRVVVERPLRLRYRMTPEDKARFLDAVPHLLDDVQAIDKQLGRGPIDDWNAVERKVRKLLKENDSKWKASEHKLFRDVFTVKEPEANPVKATCKKRTKHSEYEPDTSLRDVVDVPLSEQVDDYFVREVKPYVSDAWLDRSKDVVGYEINFDRHFYNGVSLRPLDEIEDDLRGCKELIASESLTASNGWIEASHEYRRNTGISWLPSIPRHWDLVPLRYVVSVLSGSTPDKSKNQYWIGDIPWVSPKDMKVAVLEDSIDHVSNAAIHETGVAMVHPGTVLVVIRGMILAHSFPVAVAGVPLTFNQDIKGLVCTKHLLPEFLWCYLKSIEHYVVSLADQSSHGTRKIDTDVLLGIQVPLPPTSEQSQIARAINTNVAATRTMEAALARQSALAKEMQASLVFSAMSGILKPE